MSGPFHGGSPEPAVQVVIVSFESEGSLPRCLDSLAAQTELPIEVTVVDNASGDGSVGVVSARQPRARLLVNDRNLGFSTACNQGWRSGRAPFVLFLNPDAALAPGALAALTSMLSSRPELGIVGPLTRNEDGTLQASSGRDLRPWRELRQRRLVRGVARREPRALAELAERYAREHEPDWVTGACLLSRRAALEAVSGFDEGFFLYEEDADLCRRVRAAGWRVLFTPMAEVRHGLGASAGRNRLRARVEYHRSHLRYYRKHNGLLPRLLLRLALLCRGLTAGTSALLFRHRDEASAARALLRLGLLGR